MGDVLSPIVGGGLSRKAGRRAEQGVNESTLAAASELRPTQETGRDATNFIAQLLGIGGDPGASQEAFRNFQNSTGFQEQLRRGSQAITGSQAARGLLGSGSTLKALQDRGQEMAGQSLNNFLSQLMGLSTPGVNASTNLARIRQGGGIQAANARLGGDNAFAEGIQEGLGGVDLSKLFGG